MTTKAKKAPVDVAKAAERIQKNSICVLIKMGRFTVRRTVQQAEVNVEATNGKKSDAVDQDLVTVAKDLLDSQELRDIVTYDDITKRWVKEKTVQSPLLRSSAYLLDVDALPEMYSYLEQRKKDRGPLVKAVRKAYPGLIEVAKKRLGPLFDITQYPRVEAVEALFVFEWQVIEISTPNEKLRTISKALFEKEKEKAERVWQSAVGQINDALTEGMQEVVKHMADRLGGGDEPPKRFRESALKKVTDFLDNFKQRNLAGSAELDRLAGDARKLLSGVTVKDVRKDADLQKRLRLGIGEIKITLDKMMEARPARAGAVFGSEEAV